MPRGDASGLAKRPMHNHGQNCYGASSLDNLNVLVPMNPIRSAKATCVAAFICGMIIALLITRPLRAADPKGHA